ncbi:MAG: hypothetical protein KGZ97_01260 [Bacteroidetes bacterium]|nr:hypothetical protein [Bacteroidota bacterium]
MTNCLDYNIGVRAGYIHAIYPIGKLTANGDYIEINASLFGNFILSKSDITGFLIKGRGLFGLNAIEISHKISNYPKKIVIYTYKNPKELIHEFRNFGCNENSHMDEEKILNARIIEMQSQGSFPVKKIFSKMYIVFLILTIANDLLHFFSTPLIEVPFGWGSLTFYLITIFISISLLFSKSARNKILKNGRHKRHISRGLIILIIVFVYFFGLNLFVISL